jgi:hypothetical protein
MRTASPTTANLVIRQTLVIMFFDYRNWHFPYIVHFCLEHKPPVVTLNRSRDSVVGIATRYGLEGPGIESRWGEIFRTYPDRLRGPSSLLYNGYWVFPGGKVRPVRDADPSPLSSAEVKKELSYTSTQPIGSPGPATGFPFSNTK